MSDQRAATSTIVAITQIKEKPTKDTMKPTPESRRSLRLDWTSFSNSFIATPPDSSSSIEQRHLKIHRKTKIWQLGFNLSQYLHKSST